MLSLLEAGGEEWRATSAIKDLFLGVFFQAAWPENCPNSARLWTFCGLTLPGGFDWGVAVILATGI